MRRDPLPLFVLLLLALLAGVAWLTRNPDSPVVDRLVDWPIVGPLAQRFRAAYRPAPAAPAEREGPAPEVVAADPEIEGDAPPVVEVAARPRGRAWVRAGTRLRAAPDAGSAVVETVAALRTMSVTGSSGAWRRLSRVGIQGSLSQGWVHESELAQLTPEELNQADPVLPLAAAQPDAEAVALARQLMSDDARELPCGSFLLLTDARGPLVGSCPLLAGQLDALYASRTGLEAVSDAAGAILLFESDAAYLAFRTKSSPASTREAFAAPARGFVATGVGGRQVERVRAILVHELIHLVNRRYLGPALPPWLDEGLAEELAMSRIEADGTLVPGTLGYWEVGSPEALVFGGGRLDRDRLREAMRRGELPSVRTLVGLDTVGFQAAERYQTHYSLSAFWVRYLLSGESPSGAAGFRSFLDAVAGGHPLTETLLLEQLGAGWDELETGFRRWLEAPA